MVSDKTKRYILHPAVYYRKYEHSIVLYLTSQQKVFTFGGSADVILNSFKSYSSIADVASSISAQMDPAHSDNVFEIVSEFSEELIRLGILKEEYQQYDNENNLEKEIESQFSDGKQLYTVTIELTYRCNEQCRHCYVVQKNLPELTTKQIKTVIQSLRDMNVMNLVFTGGELFVRPDTFEILEFAHNLGFVIDIFTNGNLIDGNDFIRLKRLWPRAVHFSVYSHIAEKHDSITQVKGSFEKTLHSIRACTAIGIPVNIKTPVMKETLEDIRGMAELAKSVGASIELGNDITPKMDGDLKPTELMIIEESSEQLFFDTLSDLFPSKEDASAVRSERLCGAGERSLSINPYGEVFPCGVLQLCVGNVTQNDIREIWEHSDILAWWRKINLKSNRIGCETCAHPERCIFCPGEAMMRTGSPVKRYDEACRSTQYAIDREKRKGGD